MVFPTVLGDMSPGVNGWSGPDGQTLSRQTTRITFSIGENGRPRIDVDDRIEGRSPFSHDLDGKVTFLSADSYVQAHFRAELSEDGSLTLLEAPSYRFDIRPDDFQKEYPAPTMAMLEAADTGELVRDVLLFARSIGVEHEIHALRALAAFEREPNYAHAKAVVDACGPLRDSERDPPNPALTGAIRDIIGKAELGLLNNQVFQKGFDPFARHQFGNLRQQIHDSVVRQNVLPRMIEAVRRNEPYGSG